MSTQLKCELMTVRQVAELLQVPVSWVYGRLRKRSLEKLPGYRLGKYWRFDKEEVLAWLAQQREGRKAASHAHYTEKRRRTSWAGHRDPKEGRTDGSKRFPARLAFPAWHS
jgi:excisionase family DNA binding protein